MKKLSLNALTFQKGEVLTRSQLKKILGGNGSEGLCDDPNAPFEVCYNCCIGNTDGLDEEERAIIAVTCDNMCSNAA